MKIGRLATQLCLSLAALTFGGTGAVAAQDFPNKPIRLVVPYPAGGTIDFLARVIQPHLQDVWGQTVIIENLGGASGMIGSSNVAKSRPDGYSLLLAGVQTHAMNAGVIPNMPYHSLDDFTPIAQITSVNWMVVANPSMGVKTPAEMVEALRAKPDEYTYSSSGNGSGAHLTFLALLSELGLQTRHVPYKGAAAAIQDVMAGHVDLGLADQQLLLPHIESGKLIPIAMTGKERSPRLPDLPTLHETVLPGFEMKPWHVIYGPANMDPALVDRMAKDIAKAMSNPELIKRFQDAGIDVTVKYGDELVAFTRAEYDRWVRTAREANINPQ